MKLLVLIEKWEMPKKNRKIFSYVKTVNENRKMKVLYKKKLIPTEGDIPVDVKDAEFTLKFALTSLTEDSANVKVSDEKGSSLDVPVALGKKVGIVDVGHYYLTFKLVKR